MPDPTSPEAPELYDPDPAFPEAPEFYDPDAILGEYLAVCREQVAKCFLLADGCSLPESRAAYGTLAVRLIKSSLDIAAALERKAREADRRNGSKNAKTIPDGVGAKEHAVG